MFWLLNMPSSSLRMGYQAFEGFHLSIVCFSCELQTAYSTSMSHILSHGFFRVFWTCYRGFLFQLSSNCDGNKIFFVYWQTLLRLVLCFQVSSQTSIGRNSQLVTDNHSFFTWLLLGRGVNHYTCSVQCMNFGNFSPQFLMTKISKLLSFKPSCC